MERLAYIAVFFAHVPVIGSGREKTWNFVRNISTDALRMKRGSRLPGPWPSKSIGPEPLSGLEEDRGICSLRKWNLNVIGHICIPITRRLSREGLSQFQLHGEFEVSCVYLESCLTKGEGGEVAHCVRSLATKSTELSLITEAHRGEKKNLIPANCPLTTTHVPCHTHAPLHICVNIS